jgi:hypothetical protein
LGVCVFFEVRDDLPSTPENPGDFMPLRAAATAPRLAGAWTTGSADVMAVAPVHGQTTAALQEPTARRQSAIDGLAASFRKAEGFTPEAVADLKRRLQVLRDQGRQAVPAIRDFLRSRQDASLDNVPGANVLGQRTLRLALIDLLRQIGGAEAIEASLEQLRSTESPSEIAALAINLESVAPGVYREEALSTVIRSLQTMAQARNALEVRPLFEALQALGGPEATMALERLPHNADTVEYLRNKDTTVTPTVRTYALIALANLPGGEGASSLAFLAADPEVPLAHRTVEPFRMLAQAAAHQDQAAEELIGLAQSKQIPERAWDAVASALAGRYLQFPAAGTDGTIVQSSDGPGSGAVAPFVRGFYDNERHLLYEERMVSRNWSTTQVRLQVDLIDTLLAATDSPAATQALQRAKDTLRRRP